LAFLTGDLFDALGFGDEARAGDVAVRLRAGGIDRRAETPSMVGVAS